MTPALLVFPLVLWATRFFTPEESGQAAGASARLTRRSRASETPGPGAVLGELVDPAGGGGRDDRLSDDDLRSEAEEAEVEAQVDLTEGGAHRWRTSRPSSCEDGLPEMPRAARLDACDIAERREHEPDMKQLLVIANPYPPMASAGNHARRALPAAPAGRTAGSRRCSREAARPARRARRVCASLRAPVPWPAALLGGGPRSTKVNRWLAVPDPYFAWVGPAVLKGRALLARERFDVIFRAPRGRACTSSRPSSAGDAGLPWLADYRDPWSTYQFRTYPTRCAQGGARPAGGAGRLAGAAAVTAVNRPIVDDLVARHTVAARPRAGAAQRVRPRRAAGDGHARRRLLDRPHGSPVRARAAGRPRSSRPSPPLPADVAALFVGVDESRVRPRRGPARARRPRRVEPFVPHAGGARLPARRRRACCWSTGAVRESMSSKVFEYLRGRPADLRHLAGRLGRPRAASRRSAAARASLPDEPMAEPLAASSPRARRAAPRRSPPPSSATSSDLLAAELDGVLDDLPRPRREPLDTDRTAR